MKNIDKETNRPSGSPVAYGGKPAVGAGSPRTPTLGEAPPTRSVSKSWTQR
ncbi:hypothetical protein [Nostoc sp. CHAB 5715]|uniref:hypothetical protein n=1 Tax=Nostoc sp. CHAB 5715 TaxID=2780400 RepID=UPI001E50F6AA|nr:hypothetical protein [Nostoc sp. CHAB 5715]MCC5623488.1 hypothetical protein [Nostoc sp. CHAB 5715]